MFATRWANERGVLSHDTALDLHDLCDIRPSKLHIAVPGRRPERQSGELHVVHSEPLADDEVTWHEAIPIVTVAKAIEQDAPSSRWRGGAVARPSVYGRRVCQ